MDMSISAAKLDIVNGRIDQQMCQLFHTEVLKKFSHEGQTEELLLPVALNSLKEQKNFVSRLADGMGMNFKASKNANIVLRKKPDPVRNNYNYLELSPSSITHLTEDMRNLHFENDNCQDKSQSGKFSNTANLGRVAGRLNITDKPPLIQLLGESPGLWSYRRSLPIFKYREEILRQIATQQVVVIAGDVGCGKTTQVPQYILENAHERNQPCRIISIQTRRISVHAAADRVTIERGVVGERIVGFQSRLESRGTNNCPLIFCTTGVFLRTIIENERCLNGVTHVIIDQVHERDRFTDLLLGVFRLRLDKYPNLRLILLSANIAPHTLSSYFHHEESIIKIPVPSHPVSELFLEDILTCTKFMSKQSILVGANGGGIDSEMTLGPATYFDELIADAWFNGSDNAFMQMLKLIHDGGMSIDYQHSHTGITLLMAGAGQGKVDVVKFAMAMGANPTFQVNGMTPYDLANEFARPEIADLLLSYSQVFNKEMGRSINIIRPSPVNHNSPDDVLKSFYAKYSQDHVNLELIVEVLGFVQGYSQPGTVLVLLPAYSEVVELRDMIIAGFSDLKQKLEVHTLHGHLQINDFKKLFLPAAVDKRKVILATNIAETSIYFNDVVCVIDSGLFRDRENDVVYTSPRKTQWISKACAAQRIMHVRNGGIIFHLYPRSTLEGFQEYPIPEITRDPLIDVCLFARLVIPDDIKLPQFFCSLPDGPPTTAVHQATETLESIDAFDKQHKITEVGWHLIDLPVEPRLAKMLLVAVGLRCLDPVMTIACCMARDDPFITPSSPEARKIAMIRKFEMTPDNLSDHLAILRAYHLWEKANDEGKKRQVCQENYLSVANFELIFFLRVLLVGELRASGYIRGRGCSDIRNLNIHSDSWIAIKGALTSGLYPNLARYSPTDGGIITQNEMRSQFHFTSTLLLQEGRNNGMGRSNTHARDGFSNNEFTPIHQVSKLFSSVVTCPWIVFEDQQRAGQFSVLRCCTAVTPMTILLFAGHLCSNIQLLQLNQNDHHELSQRWDPCDDEQDDMDDEEMLKLCQELHLQHLSEDIIGLNRMTKANKKTPRNRKQFVVLKIDDFVGFVVETNVAQLILNIRHKFQTVLFKCIREPGRTCSAAEDATLRTVLSVLSAEETAMNLPQPSGIGRRPANVSAESMLVTPDLREEDLYPVRRCTVYTPPPKGYYYEVRDKKNTCDNSSLAVRQRPKFNKSISKNETTHDVSSDPTTGWHNLTFQGTPTPLSNFVPAGGRPLFKTYHNHSYSEGF